MFEIHFKNADLCINKNDNFKSGILFYQYRPCVSNLKCTHTIDLGNQRKCYASYVFQSFLTFLFLSSYFVGLWYFKWSIWQFTHIHT